MRKLAGRSSMQTSATRERSPPESTPTFLNTSSPRNKKHPKRLRASGAFSREAADSAHSRTVMFGSSSSAWFCEKNEAAALWPNLCVPLSGASWPVMSRQKVDFPAPHVAVEVCQCDGKKYPHNGFLFHSSVHVACPNACRSHFKPHHHAPV